MSKRISGRFKHAESPRTTKSEPAIEVFGMWRAIRRAEAETIPMQYAGCVNIGLVKSG